MQQTTKYKFNLIETSDPFGPEALNKNTQAVEDKLSAVEAAHAADKAALQTAIQAAQTTANSAYKPGQLPWVVGSYTGTGQNQSQTVNLGFRPSMLVITGLKYAGTVAPELYAVYFACTTGKELTNCITVTNTGFTVLKFTAYPLLNDLNRVYSYIAFR